MRVSMYAAAAAVLAISAASGVSAQSTQNASPPAELPPESFDAAQFVDSRGCVFLRAGVDGSVTWVPRVTATRKQVCGYPPTFQPTEVEQVEVADQVSPSDDQPVQTGTGTKSPVVATVSPQPRPIPVVVAQAAPAKSKPKPVQRRAVVPMVTVNQGTGQIPQKTHLLARHVYDKRANTRNVSIPRGYRPVWDDGRLNPNRAVMTAKPSVARTIGVIPRGYKEAWDDNRLNGKRGGRTARGDAQTDQIWSQTVPRVLLPVPTRGQVVAISVQQDVRSSPYWRPAVQNSQGTSAANVTRLSTRSKSQPKFVLNDR